MASKGRSGLLESTSGGLSDGVHVLYGNYGCSDSGDWPK